MKKKTLLLSILSIIMCLSLTVGGTFALFTSKSEVNVAVNSGTVNVTATVKDLQYKTLTKDWTAFEDGSTTTVFDNINGLATVDGQNVTLERIVPGDGLSFKIDVTNNSNVKVKYRTVITSSDDTDSALFNALEITVDEVKFNGAYATNWAELEASTNGEVVETISVKVELPKTAGEEQSAELMGKTCKFTVLVQAIQGNAAVANVGDDGETITETNVTSNENSAVVPAGVKMADGATTLTLKVEEATESNTGNFAIGSGAETYSYEVKIPEVAQDNEEEIIVTIKAPAGLTNVLMFHEGVAMNLVASADAVALHNDYFYDANDGTITFATKNFSNFTVVDAGEVKGTLVYTADDLVKALENKEDVVLARDIKIDPANMSNAYGTTGINVKFGQTIDGQGHILDIKGAGGTWDSGINTTGGIIKNITVTGSFRGIFINHNSAHSEKVVLENVIIDGTVYTISCDQGMYQNFVAINSTFNGWTSFAATLGDATFVNCKFGKGNGNAFCRPYSETVFENCEFAEGYKIDPVAKVAFDGCTLGGEALTEENLTELVISKSENASFVKYVSNVQELKDALVAGGKYALANDIVLDSTITIADGVKANVNMKGFAISYESGATGKNTYAIDVYGDLTMSNGSLSIKHVSDDMSWNNCTAVFHMTYNGNLTLSEVNVENLGGTAMAYGVDITNVYKKNSSKLNIYNSTIKSTYIAVRVFNNGDGVHNVQINDTKLEGKYSFWVQYYIGDFKDEETTKLKLANLKIDIYNADNEFVCGEDKVSAILYGFNEATYFDAQGNVVA